VEPFRGDVADDGAMASMIVVANESTNVMGVTTLTKKMGSSNAVVKSNDN
jgi:hypothetical protein